MQHVVTTLYLPWVWRTSLHSGCREDPSGLDTTLMKTSAKHRTSLNENMLLLILQYFKTSVLTKTQWPYIPGFPSFHLVPMVKTWFLWGIKPKMSVYSFFFNQHIPWNWIAFFNKKIIYKSKCLSTNDYVFQNNKVAAAVLKGWDMNLSENIQMGNDEPWA